MNAKTTETLTWIDTLPAIPLARGVPVCTSHPDPDEYGDYGILLSATSCPVVVHPEIGEDWVAASIEHLRIDLDEPQGFGYALRWLDGGSAMATERSDGAPVLADVLFRHLSGKTTDADRLALARAIAEVSR